MSKILVTGGCGYIGSHTIVDLINNGFDVISIDNLSKSNPVMFEGIKKITGKTIQNLEIDLADEEAVKSIYSEINDVDGIIHFAAYKAVGESVEQPVMYYRNNLNSLLNMLEATKACNIPYFVFSSSCSVYGNVEKLPVVESTPMGEAECPYARTKQMGEQIIEDFLVSNNQLQSILLRYFNPVGAHESAEIGEMPIGVPNNLVPLITQAAYGIRDALTVYGDDYNTRDGSCIRDYIHVMDIANAHTKALQYLIANKMTSSSDIFNIGTGNGITVLEMLETFKSANKVDLNYKIGGRRAGDIEAVYADNTKAKELLGWEIKRDLDKMMQTAWAWQKKLGK